MKEIDARTLRPKRISSRVLAVLWLSFLAALISVIAKRADYLNALGSAKWLAGAFGLGIVIGLLYPLLYYLLDLKSQKSLLRLEAGLQKATGSRNVAILYSTLTFLILCSLSYFTPIIFLMLFLAGLFFAVALGFTIINSMRL